MLKSFLSFLLILFCHYIVASPADSTRGSYGIQIRGDLGFVIAHRPSVYPVQQGHVHGLEISLSRRTNGAAPWESVYNFPDYGLTLAGFNLGSPERLGYGIGVYPYIDFPLGKGTFENLHLRFGMGAGYIEKVFDPESNIKNAVISSHVNGVIHLDLHYTVTVSRRLALEIGAALTHFSNGAYALPNLGINIAQANLAIEHSFGASKEKFRNRVYGFSRSGQYHVYAGGFFKKISPPKGKNYTALVISGMRLQPFSFKSAWGIGADIFIDRSIAARIDMFGDESSEADNFRPAIYGAYHLTAGKVGLMFNMGYYLHNAWPNDGYLYQRVCVRYYLEKLFFCINLKSHFARADFFEIGAGYRFMKKN